MRAALTLTLKLKTLFSSRRARIVLVALLVYILDAWILGSFCVFFKDASLSQRMLHNPFYAAVVFPFQGVFFWWLFLNLVVGAAGFVVFLKLSATFPSLFRIKKREPEFTEDPSCGTSRWLTKAEAEKVLSFGHGPGIIFGKMEGEPVRLDSPRLNRNVIVWGPPGRMKTRALVVPNLLQAALSNESCVVTDPKKDILPVARPFFESRGYTVKVFDLIDMPGSDRWNPMSVIKNDIDAQLFSEVIIANTTVAGIKKVGGDQFWTSAEQNLLKALALYVVNNYPPEARNMESLYALLSCGSLDQLDLTFGSLSPDHPARAPYNIFSQADKRVRADVIQGLGVRIQVFQNKEVKRLTGASDIDLEAPGLEKCAYFCCVRDTDSTFDFLASLFFSFLFIKLVRLADGRGGPCPVPVRFVLDEFCNIGIIPDFKKKIATVRSRGLSLILIAQDLPQLRDRFPGNEWEEIVACCDSQLFFGGNDQSTLKYVSDQLGTGTVERVAVRNRAMTLEHVQVMRSPSPRNLMTPDELRRLDLKKAVLILGGLPPALIDKLDYTEHPLGGTLDRKDVKVVFPDEPAGAKHPETGETPPAGAPEDPEEAPQTQTSGGISSQQETITKFW